MDDGSCREHVAGCISPTALNFDSQASAASKCIYTVLGCMQAHAIDFSGTANVDDGSCVALGCTEPLALNFDTQATIDDMSCRFPARGCTDSRAANFWGQAEQDDQSCQFVGCSRSDALNYLPLASIDDGRCRLPVSGCTNSLAINFASAAQVDRGDCQVGGCTDNTLKGSLPFATFDDGTCQLIVPGCTDSRAANYFTSYQSNDGSCLILGCTDSSAVNYDQSANRDNGRCAMPRMGCIHARALNFRSVAEADDGTCEIAGCTHSKAMNYDHEASFDDASCIYKPESVPPSTPPEEPPAGQPGNPPPILPTARPTVATQPALPPPSPGTPLPEMPSLSAPPGAPGQALPGCPTDPALVSGGRPLLSLDGPGYAVSGSARQASLDVHERSFGFFVAATPGAAGSVRASMGARMYGLSAAYSLASPLAAAVEAKTRTSTLYVDRNSLRVAYQLRDAAGESRVTRDQLSVSLRLTFEDGALDHIVGCGQPAMASGIGECGTALPASFFGQAVRQATVEVSARYGSATAMVSSSGSVALQAAVVHSSLVAAGMVATMPASPRFVGDEFEVLVRAHTGPANFALKGWSVRLQYDVAVLTLVRQVFSSVYQAPTYVLDPSAGTLDAVTTGVSATQPDAAVQGKTALHLMTLRFRVVGGISGAALPVLSGTVGAMVNQGTQRYLTDAAISVADGRGGLHEEGTLVVDDIEGVGVFAYMPTGSFVNTAAINGVAISSSVSVMQLYSRASTASALTTEYVCASSDGLVVTVEPSCAVGLTAQHVRGGAVVAYVRSAAGTVLALVPLNVWYPLSVTVSIGDAELARVDGVGVASSCESGADRFQQTQASASATFGGVQPAVEQLDVSGLVSFSSNDTGVVIVAGHSVRGVGVGSALVGTNVAAATLAPLPASVSVSRSLVTVSGLRAVVVTGVAWASVLPGAVPWLASANVTASVQLLHSFSREGDEGEVFTYALFSDGTESELAASEVAVLSATPSLAASMSGDSWQLSVQVGALRECGDLLAVEWRVCNRSAAFAAAAVNLRMPSVTAVHATVLTSRLTVPEDGASMAPISVPRSATVSVLVGFSDGTQRDFSTDSRTLVEVDASSSACARIDGISTLVMLRDATCERVVVFASVPALAPDLNGTTSVPIVRFAALELQVLPFPSFSGYEQVLLGSLRRLGCTESYQHGQLRISARLSDASSIGVTAECTVTSLAPSVLSVQQGVARWRLVPQTAGVALINASFGLQSSALDLPVLEVEVHFTGVTMSISDVDVELGGDVRCSDRHLSSGSGPS